MQADRCCHQNCQSHSASVLLLEHPTPQLSEWCVLIHDHRLALEIMEECQWCRCQTLQEMCSLISSNWCTADFQGQRQRPSKCIKPPQLVCDPCCLMHSWIRGMNWHNLYGSQASFCRPTAWPSSSVHMPSTCIHPHACSIALTNLYSKWIPPPAQFLNSLTIQSHRRAKYVYSSAHVLDYFCESFTANEYCHQHSSSTAWPSRAIDKQSMCIYPCLCACLH